MNCREVDVTAIELVAWVWTLPSATLSQPANLSWLTGEGPWALTLRLLWNWNEALRSRTTQGQTLGKNLINKLLLCKYLMSRTNTTPFNQVVRTKYRVWRCLPRSGLVDHEVDSCFQAPLCQHSSYTLTSHHIFGAIKVLFNGPFTSGCRNHNLAIAMLNKCFYMMLTPYNSQPKQGERRTKSEF